jgi:putative ABC transport system permease protein
MRAASTVQIALRALLRNKMRSTLTALGIIIGVGAVIAMSGIGNGAKAQVEAQIASLGQNVILVFSGNMSPNGIRTGWGGAGNLRIQDARAIEQEVAGVTLVSPEVRASAQIAAGSQNWNTMIQGASETYLELRDWPLEEGSFFTDQDVRGATKVAVIGKTVARELFGDESPVGQTLRVRNVPFQILGVLAPKGFSLMGSDQDDTVLIPYTSAMKRITGNNSLRTINIKVASAADLAPTQTQIIDLLRQRHHIRSGKEDDFTVRNQQEISQMATSTSKVLSLLLGAIASVSLLVGGIGIMNIMLVSVTERTREIGIRMAVGAQRRDILLQFLIEAVTLSSLGGILGILLGIGTASALSALAQWPTLISSTSVAAAFLFSAAIGIFFGFYPAKKAAELDPIEALRFE